MDYVSRETETNKKKESNGNAANESTITDTKKDFYGVIHKFDTAKERIKKLPKLTGNKIVIVIIIIVKELSTQKL